MIAVSDDGRGIDTALLHAKAESRPGLAGPDEVLSQQEMLDLVFLPGCLDT